MAIRPTPPPAGVPPTGKQVFRPRASVYKFQSYFPLILAGLALLVGLGTGIAYWLHLVFPKLVLWWMIPLFMAFPAVAVAGGAIHASRLTQSRVVLDDERLVILQGREVQASIPWGAITRLSVRKEREEDLYEIWLRDQAVRLPAQFFENGDQLLQAVSARTRRAWERPRPRTQP